MTNRGERSADEPGVDEAVGSARTVNAASEPTEPERSDVDPMIQWASLRVGSMARERWQLVRLLGVGGMAAVYEAVHRNGSRVAIKVLHGTLASNPEVKRRFLQEGYASNRVEHQGTVRVLDDDELEDGSPFLVMELLEGETLESRVRSGGGRLSPRYVVDCAQQILSTLAAAHAKGVLHRDLKPENLFVTAEGLVKILDFGIARVRDAGGPRATKTGSVMGTPAFMAPEQARGISNEVDVRTDLWAVGATMIALLTGRDPHVGRSTNEVLLSAMTKPLEPLLTLAPDVGPKLAAAIDRAVAFERSHRYASAEEMANALKEAWVADGGVEIPDRRVFLGVPGRVVESNRPPIPTSPQPRSVTVSSGTSADVDAADAEVALPRERRGPTLVVGAAAAALVVAGFFLLRRNEGAPPAPEVEPAAVLRVAESALAATAAPLPIQVTASASTSSSPIGSPARIAGSTGPLEAPVPAVTTRAVATTKPRTSQPTAPPPSKPPTDDLPFSSRQ